MSHTNTKICKLYMNKLIVKDRLLLRNHWDNVTSFFTFFLWSKLILGCLAWFSLVAFVCNRWKLFLNRWTKTNTRCTKNIVTLIVDTGLFGLIPFFFVDNGFFLFAGKEWDSVILISGTYYVSVIWSHIISMFIMTFLLLILRHTLQLSIKKNIK